jgi:hypothetical protein
VKKEILRLDNNDSHQHLLLYAISSSASDIRLCQEINRVFGIGLTLSRNIELFQQDKTLTFRRYEYESHEEIEKYTLLVNRQDGNVLMKELSKIDFILLIHTEAPKAFIEVSLQNLKSSPEITALYKYDPKKIRSFNRIIF